MTTLDEIFECAAGIMIDSKCGCEENVKGEIIKCGYCFYNERRQQFLSDIKAWAMENLVCEKCKGEGQYADHDLPSRHGEDGGCISCPIAVQCEQCYGTGTKSYQELKDRINKLGGE